MVVALCLTGLSGCTPAIQKASSGASSIGKITERNVDWAPLQTAIRRSAASTVFKIKSSVSLKDGSMHTHFSVYGTVNLPDKISVSLTENNFNISYFQQGKVAYADEQGIWKQTQSMQKFDAYQGYVELIQKAITNKLPLNQLNRSYVVNEYCDVYQVTMPTGSVSLPSFLADVSGASGAGSAQVSAGEPIQYTFFVGEKTGYLREVQTTSVSGVNEVGPVAADTDTTFFDIDKPNIAKITVPKTLVKQLEASGQ